MSYDLANYISLRYSIEELISDNGWLLEQSEIIRRTSLQDIIPEVYIPGEGKEIITIKIDVSNHYKKTYRNYMKVQDLFAKIGGLLNALFISVKLLISDYVDFRYRKNYIEFSIDNNKIRKFQKTNDNNKESSNESKLPLSSFTEKKLEDVNKKIVSDSVSFNNKFTSLNALGFIINKSNVISNKGINLSADINIKDHNDQDDSINNNAVSNKKGIILPFSHNINNNSNISNENSIKSISINNTPVQNDKQKYLSKFNPITQSSPQIRRIYNDIENHKTLENNFIESNESNSKNINQNKVRNTININNIKQSNNTYQTNQELLSTLNQNKHNTINIVNKNNSLNQINSKSKNSNHVGSSEFFKTFLHHINFDEKAYTTLKKNDIIYYTSKLNYIAYIYFRLIEFICCCFTFKYKSLNNIMTKLLNSNITREKYSLSHYLNNIQKLKNLEDNFKSFKENIHNIIV